MKIKEFVEKRKLKLAKTEDHIVCQYKPYAWKMTEAMRIAEMTMWKGEGESRRFQMNTPLRYVLFVQCMIMGYTDLEFDDDDVVNDFDLLNSEGVLDEIVASIPKREYEEFDTILKMTVDDIIANERDLVGWLDKGLEFLLKTMNNLSEDEKFVSMIKQSDNQ